MSELRQRPLASFLGTLDLVRHNIQTDGDYKASEVIAEAHRRLTLTDPALRLLDARNPQADIDRLQAQVDALTKERDGMIEPLRFAIRWLWNPDEHPTEQFERIADWFHYENPGYLRPGKSYPMESSAPEDADVVWEKWRTEKNRQCRQSLIALLDLLISTQEPNNND